MDKSISHFLFFSLIALFSGILLSCGNGSPNSTPSVPTELEGTWVGHALGVGDTTKLRMTFTGNDFVNMRNSPTGFITAYAGTFSLNTSTVPKQMDALITQSAFAPQYVGKTSLCIYKISNDTFMYAGNEPGSGTRPASFDTATGGISVVYRLIKQ